METITITSMEQVINIISETNPSDLIFWVGAGIDLRYPTCLPLGDSLRSEVLKLSIGERLSKLIDTEWDRTYKELADMLKDRVWLSRYQRLETIIDCIQDFENNLLVKDSSIIRGLSCFSDIDPNYNHSVLAHFISEGASVVTTNYESCIQKAYEEITDFGRSLSMEYEDPSSSVYVYGDETHTIGKVHYIHGVATAPEKIGVSLSSIKKGVGTVFSQSFKEWIQSGKTILYLGYSGSDSLDVTPLIMECAHGGRSTAIYIKHVNNTPIVISAESASIPSNEKILLQPFGRKLICECNTTGFINGLGHAIDLASPKEEPECKERWLDLFKEAAKPYDEKLFYTLTTRILFELNILTKDIICPDEFKLAESYGVVEDWFINYFCFRAAHLQGDKTNMRKYAERYVKEKLPALLIDTKKIARLRKNSMALDYYTAVGIGFNALILHQKPSKINDCIQKSEKEIIQWAPTSQYNRYLTGTVLLISLFPFISSIIIKSRRFELQTLIESMNKIIKSGYENVVSVNQINIAYRAVGLAKNLLNIDHFAENQEMINLAMQNYANTTHMHGVSTTLVFSAYSYCVNYQRTKDLSSKDFAIRDLIFAARIANVTDDRTLMLRLFLAKLFATYALHTHIPFRIHRSEVILDEK